MKALKITKGKPFSSGIVFVDGKYLPPPYVVERYGNVIRVNKIQVSHPVIEWSEFVKTQEGAVVTRAEQPVESVEVSEPEPQPEPEPVVEAVEEDDDPLAELFDDAPPKKTAAKKPAAPRPPVRKAASKPKVVTSVSFDGEFEMNDRAKMLVNRVNAVRTEIDASLRRGCFICFGSTYSRVLGDSGAAEKVLEDVPKIMQRSSDVDDFTAAMRKAGFIYFPSNLIREMFENRRDYLLLQKRWKKILDDRKFNAMLDNTSVDTL